MSADLVTLDRVPPKAWALSLSGEQAQLVPYFRGVQGPDFIAGLWHLMVEDNALEHVFQAVMPGDRLADLAYDLTNFVRFFDPLDGSRVLVVVVAKATDEQPEAIAGLIWFDELIPGHRASINIWIRQPYRGGLAREAARLAIRGAFLRWELQTLWASTPWQSAYAIARRCGFKPEAVLHQYVHTRHGLMDLHVLRLSRAELFLEEEAPHGQ